MYLNNNDKNVLRPSWARKVCELDSDPLFCSLILDSWSLILDSGSNHISQVVMGLVVTDVVEINFDNEYITLNVEFVLRWKVYEYRYKFKYKYKYKYEYITHITLYWVCAEVDGRICTSSVQGKAITFLAAGIYFLKKCANPNFQLFATKERNW